MAYFCTAIDLNNSSPEEQFRGFVAETTYGEIVGVYMVSFRKTRPPYRIVDGASVLVLPEYRSQGISKVLLEFVVQDLVVNGCVGMLYFIGEENEPSIRLHAALQPKPLTSLEGLHALQIALPTKSLALENYSLPLGIKTDFGRPEDYNKIMKLLRQIQITEIADYYSGKHLADTDLWRCSLNRRGLFYTIMAKLQNSNEIVGYATFFLSYCIHYRNVLILDSIVVVKEHRRKGIGKALIVACLEAATKIVSVNVIRIAAPSQDSDVMAFFKNLGAFDKTIDSHWLWCSVGEKQMKTFSQQSSTF